VCRWIKTVFPIPRYTTRHSGEFKPSRCTNYGVRIAVRTGVLKFRLGCHIWVLSYFNVRWSHSECSFTKTITYDPTLSGHQKILTNICEMILRYRMRNVYKVSIRNSKGNGAFWIPRHRRLWYLMRQGVGWIHLARDRGQGRSLAPCGLFHAVSSWNSQNRVVRWLKNDEMEIISKVVAYSKTYSEFVWGGWVKPQLSISRVATQTHSNRTPHDYETAGLQLW
jgi:hypothetical protein